MICIFMWWFAKANWISQIESSKMCLMDLVNDRTFYKCVGHDYSHKVFRQATKQSQFYCVKNLSQPLAGTGSAGWPKLWQSYSVASYIPCHYAKGFCPLQGEPKDYWRAWEWDKDPLFARGGQGSRKISYNIKFILFLLNQYPDKNPLKAILIWQGLYVLNFRYEPII